MAATTKTEGNHNPKRIVVVSGQPRSGTSLLMRILLASGIPAVADDSKSFELAGASQLHRENWWVLELPDGCAIKVLFPGVMHLPEGANYTILWCCRSPREQAKSQVHFVGAPRQNIHPISKAIKKNEKWVASNLEIFPVQFEKIIKKEKEMVESLSRKVGVPIDTSPVFPRSPKWSGLRVGHLEETRVR